MDEKKLFDENGSLMLFNKVTEADTDLLLKLVARGHYDYINLLRYTVKDDMSLIKLLDVMSGQKVQFPERRKIYKTLEKVFIYNYCKSQNFSEESFVFMAKQYGKRVPQAKAIVRTMEKFLNSTNDSFDEYDVDSDLDESDTFRM